MTKKTRVFASISHLLGWLFFMSLPLIFFSESELNIRLLMQSAAYWIYGLTFITLFYIFLYLIIPKLFFRKNKLPFYLAILVLFGFVYFLKPYDRLITSSRGLLRASAVTGLASLQPIRPSEGRIPQRRRTDRKFDIVSIYLFLLVLALSMAVRIATEWRLSVRRALAAEADRANAELSLLKAQINPHFLFNTLNNIYTLVRTKREAAADSVLKLSHIMRFVTEEASKDFLPLRQEIRFIDDYIALQKLKLGLNSDIDYKVEGTIVHQQIAPLILIPFIENMFKYGVSKHNFSPLMIWIRVENESLTFYGENRLLGLKRLESSTGIGIKNTLQRLDAIYPGRYTINIQKESGRYITALSIDLRP
jgi:two-component system, LytTR family, sensor kinase